MEGHRELLLPPACATQDILSLLRLCWETGPGRRQGKAENAVLLSRNCSESRRERAVGERAARAAAAGEGGGGGKGSSPRERREGHKKKYCIHKKKYYIHKKKKKDNITVSLQAVGEAVCFLFFFFNFPHAFPPRNKNIYIKKIIINTN